MFRPCQKVSKGRAFLNPREREFHKLHRRGAATEKAPGRTNCQYSRKECSKSTINSFHVRPPSPLPAAAQTEGPPRVTGEDYRGQCYSLSFGQFWCKLTLVSSQPWNRSGSRPGGAKCCPLTCCSAPPLAPSPPAARTSALPSLPVPFWGVEEAKEAWRGCPVHPMPEATVSAGLVAVPALFWNNV